ncbi:high-affinity Zn transporter zrt1 [Podospora fimiseda]|uniref:High-affinity Zn transporter zrt1 n=1 Tax=Podospora fimiseda TaxID=252190 RepID=A0AAN7GRI6_9PEZI|nr:high-affinity Zn transporter zrt1 [Podospora fimiseda]
MALAFDPKHADLTDENARRAVICYLTADDDDAKKDRTSQRLIALFTILVTSIFCTTFPLWAKRFRWLPRPLLLFARYVGAGVIIATSFIHLLAPANETIGPMSCVGVTGGWQNYPWPVAITMTSFMMVFLMGFASEMYLERKFDHNHGCEKQEKDMEKKAPICTSKADVHQQHQFLHSSDQDVPVTVVEAGKGNCSHDVLPSRSSTPDTQVINPNAAMVVRNQITSFMVLEFGVIFHSVIIGLNLGVAGRQLPTLFAVMVFHQAFEGLGLGARLSVINFPSHLCWVSWAACIFYAVTTPVAIAIGMAISNHYDPESFKAKIVSGVLDSISAGILMYTGFIELLARDFLFNPERTRNSKTLCFMLFCLFLGIGIMALLGRWA